MPHPDMQNVHPDAYPKHDNPEKGQIYNGECNIPGCATKAQYWHCGHYAFVCYEHAIQINTTAESLVRATVGSIKPTFESMERYHKAHSLFRNEDIVF